MPWDTEKNERLGRVLTREQLIRVEKIMSCDKGSEQKLSALKEYYSRDEIKEHINSRGWDSVVLAYSTLSLAELE